MRIFSLLIALVSVNVIFADIQEKKPITIVTCSYNNRNYYQKNLASLLEQKYPNYRVIYVDDCSPDGTGEAVEEYLKNHPNGHKVKLIRNPTRKKAMANLWCAIHMCKDEEIVVIVDGDDWLPHPKVLDIVASYYEDPDVWFAYSNYLNSSNGRAGISRPIPNHVWEGKGVRAHQPYCVSHLHSFYAGLFKKIKLRDFTYQGDFVAAAYDCAMYFPMLEMAQGHVTFMKEKLYMYNNTNPINDHRANRGIQSKVHQHTRKLNPYQPAKGHPAKPAYTEEENQVDLVVYSYNRPMQLQAYIESFYKHTKNINHITVIYRADGSDYEKGYEKLKNTFSNIQWIKQERPPNDFKRLTLNAIYHSNSKARFVVFAVDDIIVKDKVDFHEVIGLMDKTHAYVFHLRMGKNITRSYMAGKADSPPRMIELEPGLFAWKFGFGGAEWGYANSVDMGVYRKEDIRSFLEREHYTNPNLLEGRWSRLNNQQRFGLCYERSKTINIPMNVVSTFKNKNLRSFSAKELLSKFMRGDRIDIDAVYQMENKSPHVNVVPTFKKSSH